jgi:5'-3' exonuclease
MSNPQFPKNEFICLIDADSLMYYEMDKPTLEIAMAGIDQRVGHILKQCNTDKYVGFLTPPRCFRYDVAADYKGNRKGKSKPPIFYALRAYLEQTYMFKTISKLEADDAVSLYSNLSGHKSVICSPDKDVLYQCPGIHYNYRTSEFIDTSVEEGLKFLWKQVLMGDSTDHIPGLPGVGTKTADNWLQDRKDNYESFAIRKYTDKLGPVNGVLKLCETFRLVYMLRTDDDCLRESGKPLPELEVFTFEVVQEDEAGW